MALSALDLFSIGIGPSSSHTVGPMKAAKRFADDLLAGGRLTQVARLRAELFGSLGATGLGHGSDKAVILGLQGHDPATVDTALADSLVAESIAAGTLQLAGGHRIGFDDEKDVILHRRKALPGHPNAMTFAAFDAAGTLLEEQTYYSVGGGFVVDEHEFGAERIVNDDSALPYPFTTGAQLLAHCSTENKSIAQIMLANELTWRSEAELRGQLLEIWAVMEACVENGCTRTEDLLPGGLKVRRRAPALREKLRATEAAAAGQVPDPLWAMEWVNLYALAVNEENASGGRIVTAPTNGAAGIIPAVLHFFMRFMPGANEDKVVEFLLTAAAIGILFKENASISGAEVGCQGEVGSACSMAAGALCAVLGGTPAQVENAAEVGIEHNLGLTCDPIGGLVQIPCIERNAIASVKAINAARLCLQGNGEHKVSLDAAIETMRQTGADMKTKYKETSRGGLAVNVTEC
ncbi:L-serine ammonia-lyase [Paeniglutamicibacter psychrophenolicus]|uniref:L-serine ammonia-lyase n=1 Tax=Paeniglutamicibacter psychrophenolicus TaxID=257454 RepID=UPI002781FF62|nr:L-serine ammonia-lyase [Paeniglutamicibacter psychrophenolicus]MDQ0092289.1 L-serine dehydratase [Paeniglutamicibacter psychrophenolicus]